MMGQQVDVLFEGNLLKGVHQIQWHPHALQAGMYICKINVHGKETFVITEKMQVVD